MGCETRKLNHDNNTLSRWRFITKKGKGQYRTQKKEGSITSSGSVTSIAFCSERIHGTHGFAVIALRQVKISCNVFFWNFSTFKSPSLIVASPAFRTRPCPDGKRRDCNAFARFNTHPTFGRIPCSEQVHAADVKRRDYKKSLMTWPSSVSTRTQRGKSKWSILNWRRAEFVRSLQWWCCGGGSLPSYLSFKFLCNFNFELFKLACASDFHPQLNIHLALTCSTQLRASLLLHRPSAHCLFALFLIKCLLSASLCWHIFQNVRSAKLLQASSAGIAVAISAC